MADGCVELVYSVQTVKVENNKFNRKVREALQYNKFGRKHGGYNLDDGKYVQTQIWTPFFDFPRKRNHNKVNGIYKYIYIYIRKNNCD